MTDEETPVSELGESALIERFVRRIGPAPAGEIWSGDDTAVVRVRGGDLLFTTDVLVEGVDFDTSYATAPDIGWKATAVNVSDLAAMGGRPSHAVATLCLPAPTTIGFVDGIMDGMLEAAGEWAMQVVGGDISEAPQLALGMAVLGSAEVRVLRSGAGAGEALCVTGTLGGAAAGLNALRRGLPGREELKLRQLRPRARVEEGAALAAAGATAMIDLSDGLARDLARLLDVNGLGCEVDPKTVPVQSGLDEVTEDAIATAIVGGEDFELLCTLAEDRVDQATRSLRELGRDLTRIGTTTDGAAHIGGESLSEWRDRGWEHLRIR